MATMQAKAIGFAKSSLWGKNLNAKNILETFLQNIAVVLYKKAARQNSYYSENETILKIGKNGHQAKPRAFEKSLI